MQSTIETQRDFLIRNGIMNRAKILVDNGADKEVTDRQMNRLLHPQEMGDPVQSVNLFRTENNCEICNLQLA